MVKKQNPPRRNRAGIQRLGNRRGCDLGRRTYPLLILYRVGRRQSTAVDFGIKFGVDPWISLRNRPFGQISTSPHDQDVSGPFQFGRHPIPSLLIAEAVCDDLIHQSVPWSALGEGDEVVGAGSVWSAVLRAKRTAAEETAALLEADETLSTTRRFGSSRLHHTASTGARRTGLPTVRACMSRTRSRMRREDASSRRP